MLFRSWSVFQPFGVREAATEAKDLGGPLGGPLGGGRGGLGSPTGVEAGGGFAVRSCFKAERSGAFKEGSGGGGGGGSSAGADCCCLGEMDSMAGAWSNMVTSLETAVEGGLVVGTPCLGKAGAAFYWGGFTFFQIFSRSSCYWRLCFASAISWPGSCLMVQVRVASWKALDSAALVRL